MKRPSLADLERRVDKLESHTVNEAKRVDKLEACIEKLDETLDKVNNKLSYWTGAIAFGAFVLGIVAGTR